MVLSCLVRAAAPDHQRQGDRAVMCRPMVPTAWPCIGPRLVIGAALPWGSWADSFLKPCSN